LTDADGRTYRFGTTAAARKSFGTHVSFWYLEQVRDVAGHDLVYHYIKDRGEVYLDSIEWGPLVGGQRAFRAALEDQARADAVLTYRAGFKVHSARRVARIHVCSCGQVQRDVVLGYDEEFALTRLATVEVQSGDGAEALPPLHFSYAAAGPGVQV